MEDRTFSCTFKLPQPVEKARSQPKRYRNPLFVAQEWQHLLDSGVVASRVDLARQLGVSRAYVTQVLQLLELAPEVREKVACLGDPTEELVIGSHTLRSLTGLPVREQEARVSQLIGRNRRQSETR
jgi:hypothetical protein